MEEASPFLFEYFNPWKFVGIVFSLQWRTNIFHF